jgi:hypothetical protein
LEFISAPDSLEIQCGGKLIKLSGAAPVVLELRGNCSKITGESAQGEILRHAVGEVKQYDAYKEGFTPVRIPALNSE